MHLNGAFSGAKIKRIIVFVVLALVVILFFGCDFFGGQKEEFFLFVKWVEDHGQVCIQPNQEKYERGTEVNLLASPRIGWKFSHWEGDAEGTEKEIEIIMDSDKNLTAHFTGPGAQASGTITIEHS